MTKNSDDNTGTAKRLRDFRDIFEGGISQRAMSERLGIDQQRLSTYEMGARIPDKVIASLMRLGLRAEWLLLGEGPMLGKAERDQEIRSLELSLIGDNIGESAPEYRKRLGEFYILPLYADEAAAGEPRDMRDIAIEGPAILHRDWCPHPDCTDYVRVSSSGTSMEPTIPAGSIVTIDRSINDPERLVGKIVAIRKRDGGVTLKRLRKTDRDGYVGMPDNPTAENRPIALEEGDAIIGLVQTVHARLG